MEAHLAQPFPGGTPKAIVGGGRDLTTEMISGQLCQSKSLLQTLLALVRGPAASPGQAPSLRPVPSALLHPARGLVLGGMGGHKVFPLPLPRSCLHLSFSRAAQSPRLGQTQTPAGLQSPRPVELLGQDSAKASFSSLLGSQRCSMLQGWAAQGHAPGGPSSAVAPSSRRQQPRWDSGFSFLLSNCIPAKALPRGAREGDREGFGKQGDAVPEACRNHQLQPNSSQQPFIGLNP